MTLLGAETVSPSRALDGGLGIGNGQPATVLAMRRLDGLRLRAIRGWRIAFSPKSQYSSLRNSGCASIAKPFLKAFWELNERTLVGCNESFLNVRHWVASPDIGLRRRSPLYIQRPYAGGKGIFGRKDEDVRLKKRTRAIMHIVDRLCRVLKLDVRTIEM